MNKESPFNLFNQHQKNEHSVPSQLTTTSHQPASTEPRSSDHAEVKDTFHKITKMYDDLKTKLDETYKKGGWSEPEIKLFLENSSNFDTYEWEKVQRERTKLSDELWNLLGAEAKIHLENQTKKKALQSNKGKFIGARKKNWIPVR